MRHRAVYRRFDRKCCLHLHDTRFHPEDGCNRFLRNFDTQVLFKLLTSKIFLFLFPLEFKFPEVRIFSEVQNFLIHLLPVANLSGWMLCYSTAAFVRVKRSDTRPCTPRWLGKGLELTKCTNHAHVNTLRTGLLNCLNARSRGLIFRHRASCI